MTKRANYHYKRWLLQSVGGLIVTGAGLSMAIDAGAAKAVGGAWFWYGTAALCVFNSGICLIGDAVLHRMRYERLLDTVEKR